tara:strand:- start:7690 stop:8964 length:1275 start_codon:yes stop_codon:yes gene_type:complete
MQNIEIIQKLKKDAFYLNRSLGGIDNLKTLKFIKKIIPQLKIKAIQNKKKVYDWVVPLNWSLNNAYIQDEHGKKIIDFKNNFLHVLNYSSKVNKIISKNELLKHLYFSKKNPKAIPYVTSYYKKDWGFCIKYTDLKKFKSKKYKVFIDAKFEKKALNYGEVFLQGKSKKEVIFSTYICHPNLGNDNFSGILINTLIAKFTSKLNRYYSYRFLFIPETIGSLFYIQKNYKNLKKNFLAGYVLSCLGKGDEFKVLNKYKENLSYKFLKNFLVKSKLKFKEIDWKERGSDERQFSSPNVNLPFCLITKTKFMDYKEYHTSLDNINFIKNKNILSSLNSLKQLISFIELEKIYLSKFKGEPFLSKRQLYSSTSSSYNKIKKQDLIVNFIDYCDGNNSLREINSKLGVKNILSNKILNILIKNNLVAQI